MKSETHSCALFLALVALTLAGCTSTNTPTTGQQGAIQNPDLVGESPVPPVIEGYVEWFPADKAKQAPDLQVETFAQKPKWLEFGKYPVPTLLFFWDCSNYYCANAAKYVQQLQDEFKRKHMPFRVIGVIMKRKGKVAAYRAFLRRQDIVYTNFFDNSEALRKMAGSSDKAVVPSFFILDRQGRVRMRKAGFKFVMLEAGKERSTYYLEDVPISGSFVPLDAQHAISEPTAKHRIADFLKVVCKEPG